MDSVTYSILNNKYLFAIYTLTSPAAGTVRLTAHIARTVFYDLWMNCKEEKKHNEQLKRNFKQILLGLVELVFLAGPCAVFFYAKTQKKTPLNPISKTLADFGNSRISGQINGVYITTNETNLSATRQFLKNHPRSNLEKQTIHIGCATWHNFDVMCERKSNYGLITDFNPENAKFIKKTIDIINASESRDLFKQNMIVYLNSLKGKSRNLFFHQDQKGLPTSRIEDELLREGSWLQTEENYLFIKKLAANGSLIAITEDITNFEKFSSIRNFLDKNNIAIDTVYLSNICNFMDTDTKKNSFAKSIKLLLRDDTILINCPKLKQLDTNQVTILHQKSILGKEVLANSYDTKKLFEEII